MSVTSRQTWPVFNSPFQLSLRFPDIQHSLLLSRYAERDELLTTHFDLNVFSVTMFLSVFRIPPLKLHRAGLERSNNICAAESIDGALVVSVTLSPVLGAKWSARVACTHGR